MVEPVLGFGLPGIWTAQVGCRVMTAAVFGVLWCRRDRARIRV